MIVHEKELYIIDVSQSVEHDHPNSLVFLRSDIANVSKCFKDNGVAVLSMRRLFEFVVDPTISDSQAREILGNERTKEPLAEDVVFMNAYIPHKLVNIEHYERDDMVEKQGNEVNNPFQKIIGKIIEKKADEAEESENEDESYTSSSESSIEMDEEQLAKEAEKERKRQLYHRDKNETSEEKTERKKQVKAEQKEKRANKIPKHVKKRHEQKKRRNR